MIVKQPGHVTRIASGCEPDEAVAIQAWFDENVQYMSKRFHLHLTPHFSGVKDENGNVIGDYKFFNKPFGLKYFLEHFELLEFNDGKFGREDDIIMLIDPDMALLRPITSDFSDDKETIIAKRRQGANRIAQKVHRGFPFAQTYGLGTQWQKFDLEKIAGAGSPAIKVSKEEGALYYPAGPPYIGTVYDMYLIAQKWTEFVPRVHAQYPYLLAEMYAFCIAGELQQKVISLTFYV
jgi:peptidyl serine alpha-galactosyltransferase